MADAFLCDAEGRMARMNLELHREEKRNYKMFKELMYRTRQKAYDCFKKLFGTENGERYDYVVERSHTLYQMMKLIVNRTTLDNEGMQDIYDAVKALPKKRDIFNEKDL